ncbi:MAG TPA: LacI family DNA-binding transcriptional regulator [Streptosporangiaceae bacterium]|nr:LacI family DNA-binding transcriptional regulator [Streptosporangiaceae bacterium]
MSTSDVLGPGAAGEGDEGRLPVPPPLGSAAIPQQPDSASRIGPAPITLYDVARMAGVSIATVSRVVHGQDRVRESTRARVREVIEHLGYVPDGAAQSLSRRRKNVIGLVCVERLAPHQYDIESMSLLFYDEILRGVEARIRDNNWSLLITYLREENLIDLARLQSLSGKVDGLLIGEGIVPPTDLARLADRLPIVVVAGDPAEQDVDVVTADNRSGAAALVNHLVDDHGRRRLFHVDGPPSAPDAKERRLALLDVLHTHPGVELIGSHTGRFSVESGEVAGVKLLANRKTLPDAVVCANDQMAIGVLQALARGGVRVPEDVAVTGFDDIFPGGLSEPSLTTVHQPMRLLGERACARLLDRIARPEIPPEVELLPTDLVLRRSCGCPPGPGARRTLAPLREASGEVASHVSRGRRHARAKSES